VDLILRNALGYSVLVSAKVDKQDLGRQGEQLAAQFLHAQHYVIVARNYRCTFGEVDLIVQDRETLVFVEVRTQSGPTFGDPLESVTLRKQRQIAKVATHYTLRHHIDNRPLRFDVIGIRWECGEPRISHVKGAFDTPARSW